jgi:hypothetical protein
MNEAFEAAERRHGLITRAQLVQLGMSDAPIQRRIATGVIARVLPNVFRVVGSVPTAAQRQLAACLWLGPSAALSHTSAGMLMRLEGITTSEIHVTVPTPKRRKRLAAIEAMGWRLVHVTWADVVERPAETLDRIRRALGTIAA